MRPDILSLMGVALAFGTILGGNFLDGGHIGALANGPAAVIVIGGTVGATLLQTPIPVFKHALRISSQVFIYQANELQKSISKMVKWSNVARKEGLLGLEKVSDQEPDLFLRKGVQLLVDGTDPSTIRSILEVDLDSSESHDLQAARVFEAMGGYSPTIGIIGAVMGLIHVMQNLAEPEKLGAGIATAFVATIYGIALANLFFLPFAAKLTAQAKARSHHREMMIEGVVGIAEGDNPRNIELRLRGFLN
jgi:chemotaxis protein MotA